MTLLILVFAFGALIAAGVPVLLAISAVIATIGLVAIPSHIFPIDDNTSIVITLIGMAVGVDYSLFYLKREREERLAGRDEPPRSRWHRRPPDGRSSSPASPSWSRWRGSS